MDITKACRDISELNSLAQQACKIFLEECKKSGINIFITETYRSQERQNYLYTQGRTRKGSIVTYTKSSNHTGRMAWDIACSPPQNLYDGNVLKKASVIANRLGIRWGGSCFGTFKDSPHFEILSTWKLPTSNYKISKIKVKVCGIEKQVDAINVSGNNYCKIRDLSVTGKFIVGYKNNTIYVNGKAFKPESIVVDNTTYIKLQSLNTIGFKVGYDSINKIPVISM